MPVAGALNLALIAISRRYRAKQKKHEVIYSLAIRKRYLIYSHLSTLTDNNITDDVYQRVHREVRTYHVLKDNYKNRNQAADESIDRNTVEEIVKSIQELRQGQS